MTNAVRMALISLTAAGLASAATYRFNLAMDATIEGQNLKAGQYSVDVNDTTAIIKGEKKTVETKVKTEVPDKKNETTTVKYNQVAGKYNLQEIHLGGKKLNLVFEPAKTSNGGLE